MRNLERDIRKKTISVLGRCCLNPVVDRFLCFYILFFSHLFSQVPLPYKIGFRHCHHNQGGERFRCQKFLFRLRIFLLLNIRGRFRWILAFQKTKAMQGQKSRTFSEKRGSFFQKRGRFFEKRRRFFSEMSDIRGCAVVKVFLDELIVRAEGGDFNVLSLFCISLSASTKCIIQRNEASN